MSYSFTVKLFISASPIGLSFDLWYLPPPSRYSRVYNFALHGPNEQSTNREGHLEGRRCAPYSGRRRPDSFGFRYDFSAACRGYDNDLRTRAATLTRGPLNPAEKAGVGEVRLWGQPLACPSIFGLEPVLAV